MHHFYPATRMPVVKKWTGRRLQLHFSALCLLIEHVDVGGSRLSGRSARASPLEPSSLSTVLRGRSITWTFFRRPRWGCVDDSTLFGQIEQTRQVGMEPVAQSNRRNPYLAASALQRKGSGEPKTLHRHHLLFAQQLTQPVYDWSLVGNVGAREREIRGQCCWQSLFGRVLPMLPLHVRNANPLRRARALKRLGHLVGLGEIVGP
ncbi:hypothetical protein HG530_005292 [Fusarium avenaceum]|nr:hypothetical protein HG530_005292 [Fusarium avenaceum]